MKNKLFYFLLNLLLSAFWVASLLGCIGSFLNGDFLNGLLLLILNFVINNYQYNLYVDNSTMDT